MAGISDRPGSRSNCGKSIALVTLVIFMASCTNGGSNDSWDPGGIPAFLPYVESIETVPPTVHEGEAYDVVAHLSSQLIPDLLRGGPAPGLNPANGKWQWTGLFNDMARSDADPEKSIIAYNPWIINPAAEGEITDSFILFSVSGAVAGTRSYKILTADSREWGGLESSYHGTPFAVILEHPHAVHREFEITVLPAEVDGD